MAGESRAFAVSALVIALVCVGLIQRGLEAVAQQSVQPPHIMLVNIGVLGTPIHTLSFVLLTMLLGLGGMQRERLSRTAAFTLALPVTRLQLVVARAAMGLLQMATISFVPVIVVPVASSLLWNESYPAGQAALFGVRFASWGAIWFSVAFVWAVILRSEYTAAVASVLTPFVYMPETKVGTFGFEPQDAGGSMSSTMPANGAR
jgi:ABC-type transport system involved in multi-copper enzyme maturation permease subunit